MRHGLTFGFATFLFIISASSTALADKGAIALVRQADKAARKGDIALAKRLYAKAIAMDGNLVKARGALAALHLRERGFKRAERLLRAAVTKDAAYAEGWYSLAYALRKTGRIDEAIDAYQRYAKLRPKSADPYYGLGLSYRVKKQYGTAAKYFRRYALLENAPSKRVWVKRAMGLAVQMEQLQRKTRAQAPTSKAAAKAPSKTAAKAASKTPNTAAKAASKTPNTAAKTTSKTPAAKQPARHAAAKIAIYVIPAPPPQKASPNKLAVQGDALARIGKCGEAMALYRKALKSDPFATSVYHGVAYCAQKKAEHAKAGTRLLRIGLRDNPDYQQGWLHLARLLGSGGDHVGAVGAYRRYARAKPSDVDARFELAHSLASVGQKSHAVAAFQEYLEKDRRAEAKARRKQAVSRLRALGGVIPAVAGAKKAKTAASGGTKSAPGAKKKSKRQLRLEALAAKREAAKQRREARKRAWLEAKRKRKEARLARIKAAKEKREARKRAWLEAKRKREEARLAKLAAAKEKREARKRAWLEAKRKRKEARLAKLAAAKEKREARRRARLERKRENRMLAAMARKQKLAARKAKIAAKTTTGSANASADVAVAKAVATDLANLKTSSRQRDVLRPAPDAAAALSKIADGQFAKRRFVVALGIYQQAIKLDPVATEPLYKAGVCALALNRMHLAARFFERVLKVDPTNATAQVNLKMAKAASSGTPVGKRLVQSDTKRAREAVASGRYARAEQLLQPLIASTKTNPNLYRLRAQARLALHKSQAALLDAGRALALDPVNANGLKLIADAHLQLQQKKRARYYYRLYLMRTEGDSGQTNARKEVRTQLEKLGDSKPRPSKKATPKAAKSKR
jgi:tetratricopeptide (TPR) repeat protein